MKFNQHLRSLASVKRIKKIPQFRMVFTSPQIRHQTHTVSTKAYTIEVLQEDIIPMIEILKLLLNASPEFVPCTLRRKYPDGCEKVIRYQTQMLTSSLVVILQNITSAMMFYVQLHNTAIPGVREILPSPKLNDAGRYSVLVDKTEFEGIRKTITHHLPECIGTVPSYAMPPETRFLALHESNHFTTTAYPVGKTRG